MLIQDSLASRISRRAVKAGDPNADARGEPSTAKLNFAVTAGIVAQETHSLPLSHGSSEARLKTRDPNNQDSDVLHDD